MSRANAALESKRNSVDEYAAYSAGIPTPHALNISGDGTEVCLRSIQGC
jgi:hypothetical protein